MVGPANTGPVKLWQRNSNEVTTPKLAPAPLTAQNRSCRGGRGGASAMINDVDADDDDDDDAVEVFMRAFGLGVGGIAPRSGSSRRPAIVHQP
jgi:hypothetical protein